MRLMLVITVMQAGGMFPSTPTGASVYVADPTRARNRDMPAISTPEPKHTNQQTTSQAHQHIKRAKN